MTEPDALFDRIQRAQQDRRADRLFLKYTAMRESSFRFFRATPYLFYKDWSANWSTIQTPVSWVCADLHLENIGSYRGRNGLVYFDINDFDEALLAPCTVDVARLVTSLFVAAPLLRHTPETTTHLASRFCTAYTQTLLRGKPQSVERETATGILQEFLTQAANRSRKELIASFTNGRGSKCLLRIDKTRLLPLEADRDTVWPWLKTLLHNQGGYRLQDAACRIAGTSSLGLSRYIALVKGPTDKLHLIDIKATRPSVAAPYVNVFQPGWPDPATRVVTLQNRLQDVPPALLWAQPGLKGEFFVGRTLQPQADRMDLTAKRVRNVRRLAQLLEMMGQLTASAHLRSGGHQGSAIADELMAFAAQPDWVVDILRWSSICARQVHTDYETYKVAFDAGVFGKVSERKAS